MKLRFQGSDIVMDTPTITLSCLIGHEDELEKIISELMEKAVARHDISIQGDPAALSKKYGQAFVNPNIVQHSRNPPKKNPFLGDDFGWVLGFSFTLPVILCVIFGVFFVGNLNDPSDNILYGILGFIIGSLIGWKITNTIKNNRKNKIAKQEEQGGFILWVVAHDEKQEALIQSILAAHKALHIERHRNINK